MLSNSEIKRLRSLREKKFRDESGLFVVEGEKMVGEALNSSFDVLGVWRTEEIGETAMSKITQLSSPSPVLALVKQAGKSVPERFSGLCLALDAVRDPGNMGTILRIADWFGVERVYLSPDCVELYNPKVVQASMGSIFRVRISTCELKSLCGEVRAGGHKVYGTLLEGDPIYSTTLESEGLVIMGNESEGIGKELRNEIDCGLRIPSFGNSGAESLNVAVATAVTLSEFRRR